MSTSSTAVYSLALRLRAAYNGATMASPHFIRVLTTAELPPGGGFPVKVGAQNLAVFNVDGVLHAIDNECPHRGGSLVDGALVGSSVICPLHRWQFSLTDGVNTSQAID